MARQHKFGKPGKNRKNIKKNTKRIDKNTLILKELTKQL